MAVSVEAVRLNEQHRLIQAQLSAQTMRDAILLWRVLAEDPQRNQATWLQVILALIRRNRARSARYATDYARAFRYLEAGPRAGPFTPVPQLEVPFEKIAASMVATGPAALAERAKKLDVERVPARSRAMRNIMESNARAVSRHVLDGGRDSLDEVVRRDPQALGWYRVTDSDPCFWCAMLASRGPVYGEDSFDESDARFSGPGNHKVHDGCACSLQPIYRRGDPGLDQARAWELLWQQTGQKYSGARAILEWRRAYEGRGEYAA